MGTEREISTITGKPVPSEAEKFRAGKWINKQLKLPQPGERRQYGVWPFDLTPKEYFKEASIYNPPKGMVDPIGVITQDRFLQNIVGRGGKGRRINSITLDLMEDYIKKIPEEAYKPLKNVSWSTIRPRAKGTYWGRHKEITVNPESSTSRYMRERPEKAGIEFTRTLLHELAHSGQNERSTYPELSKIYMQYSNYLKRVPE